MNIILLLFLISVVKLSVTLDTYQDVGLRCYRCTSMSWHDRPANTPVTEDCIDNPPVATITRAVNKYNYQGDPYCVTIFTRLRNDQIRVHRTYQFHTPARLNLVRDDGCIEGKSQKVCYCNTDTCNTHTVLLRTTDVSVPPSTETTSTTMDITTGRTFTTEIPVGYIIDEATLAPSSAVPDISEGPSFNGTNIQKISRTFKVSRGVVVTIRNHLTTSLYDGESYVRWGTTRILPPLTIQPRTYELMAFQKTATTATGTTAIVAYKILDADNPVRFAIAFSEPYNYIAHSSWFGLTLLDPNEELGPDLYTRLWNSNAWKYPTLTTGFGYAKRHQSVLIRSEPYEIWAKMSNTDYPLLQVHVKEMDVFGYDRE